MPIIKFFKGNTEALEELEAEVNAFMAENLDKDVTISVSGGEYHLTVTVFLNVANGTPSAGLAGEGGVHQEDKVV